MRVTGIDQILDQFLGEHGRALDDLAGCDLVDEQWQEDRIRHGWIYGAARLGCSDDNFT